MKLIFQYNLSKIQSCRYGTDEEYLRGGDFVCSFLGNSASANYFLNNMFNLGYFRLKF